MSKISTLAALTIAVVFGACHKKGPAEIDSDQLLFERAEKLYSRKSYTEAIEYYESLKNRFPQSPHAVESELKIADAHFESAQYPEAAVSYQSFRTLHPSHEKIPYVMLRAAQSYYNDAPRAIDRDQTDLDKALSVLSELRSRYPTAPEAAPALEISSKARRSLLRRELYVADFYRKRKKYQAAIERYATVRSQSDFPDLRDDATLAAARAQLSLKQYDEAKKSAESLLENADRERQAEAKKLIEKIRAASRG